MIRQWFGYEQAYQQNNINSQLDILLGMCQEGLVRYFKLKSAESIDDLMKVLSHKKLEPRGDRLFFDWLHEKGVSCLKKMATYDLNEHTYLQATIEYEIYIFGEELKEFEYPEEVRSCIISIANWLLELIENKEVSPNEE